MLRGQGNSAVAQAVTTAVAGLREQRLLSTGRGSAGVVGMIRGTYTSHSPLCVACYTK